MTGLSQNLIMTSVRLPADLHEKLRRIAFMQRRSLHSLLIEGSRLVAERNDDMSGVGISYGNGGDRPAA